MVIQALWNRLNDLEDRLNQNSHTRHVRRLPRQLKSQLVDSVDEPLTCYPDDTCAYKHDCHISYG